jgi:hypothetical protein
MECPAPPNEPVLIFDACRCVIVATLNSEINASRNHAFTITLRQRGVFHRGDVGNMPDIEHKLRVAEYRGHAKMLRALARQTRFPDTRARLIALADSFDTLADRVETWETTPIAAD